VKKKQLISHATLGPLHPVKGIAQGEYRFRLFVAVGTQEDVRQSLAALAAEFEGR